MILQYCLVTCSFQSQHSSSSSVDSMGRADDKPVTSAPLHRQPNFLSEMKVVLGKQAQSVDNIATESGDGTHIASLYNHQFINLKKKHDTH